MELPIYFHTCSVYTHTYMDMHETKGLFPDSVQDGMFRIPVNEDILLVLETTSVLACLRWVCSCGCTEMIGYHCWLPWLRVLLPGMC